MVVLYIDFLQIPMQEFPFGRLIGADWGIFRYFMFCSKQEKRRHPCLQNNMFQQASSLLLHTPHCLRSSVCNLDSSAYPAVYSSRSTTRQCNCLLSSRRQSSDGRLHPSYRTSSRCQAHHSIQIFISNRVFLRPVGHTVVLGIRPVLRGRGTD